MVKIISSSQEFNETIDHNTVVISLFVTRPCPMCEKVEVIFEDISNAFDKDYIYLKLIIPWSGAAEDIKQIPYNLGLRYAPALCVIKNGKVVNYLIEFLSKEQIISFIQETINERHLHFG